MNVNEIYNNLLLVKKDYDNLIDKLKLIHQESTLENANPFKTYNLTSTIKGFELNKEETRSLFLKLKSHLDIEQLSDIVIYEHNQNCDDLDDCFIEEILNSIFDSFSFDFKYYVVSYICESIDDVSLIIRKCILNNLEKCLDKCERDGAIDFAHFLINYVNDEMDKKTTDIEKIFIIKKLDNFLKDKVRYFSTYNNPHVEEILNILKDNKLEEECQAIVSLITYQKILNKGDN